MDPTVKGRVVEVATSHSTSPHRESMFVPLTLGLLEIKFCNLFQFAFHGVIIWFSCGYRYLMIQVMDFTG